MPKIIHEYWWTYGALRMSHYELHIEKETQQMLLGKIRSAGFNAGDCAVRKKFLNKPIIKNTFCGFEFKITVDEENEDKARKIAKSIIKEHMMNALETLEDA